MKSPRLPFRGLLAPLLLLQGAFALGQCPQLYDYNGVPSASPYWFSCSGTNFTLLIATPNAVGNFTVDWGDGSPLHIGASLVPPQSVSHVYPSTVDTFIVVFTEIATGCVVQGVVVMEESTSASIQIPIGGLTQICAPQAIEFINSSTNVSENTTFTWDFGDGSPPLVLDHTNWGQTISHTYLQGTVGCETVVTLEAENYCNALQGGASQATFNPIRVWDLDSANITPSATLLCWPDNEVTYLNTTDRNCLQQGNIYQRYEYWNFGDYWGQGQDSIIDWTPWPPTFPHTIAYPGIGTYEVMMLDSNYCGIDTAYVQITIVPPPDVTLSVSPDTICAGETAFFNQTTNGGANFFQWDFGTGNGYQITGSGDQAHTYHTPGVYMASYAASIQGATAGCADTASVQVVVLPSPTAQFVLSDDAACDSLTVAFTNTSINAVTHFWDLGDGTTTNQATPPPHHYGSPGDYVVSLTVTNALGCTDTRTDTVHVFDPPQVGIGAQDVCFGQPVQFLDQTQTAALNPVVQWAWDFGDGGTDTVQDPLHTFAAAGAYTVSLIATTLHCSGSGTQNVLVEAPPVAAFSPDVVLGCTPLDVNFTNTSTGAVSYSWDFGDGSTSSQTTPSHSFVNNGTADSTFTVTLVASTLFGCSDTTVMSITVTPRAVAQFSHNATPGCAPLDVDFTNLSTGAGSFFWDFGDGATSTLPNPSHGYTNTSFFLDIHTVTLVAISPAGCSDTTTQQITVFPEPNFSFVTEPDSGCSPLSVTFPSVVGAVSYQWDFGDGSTGTGPTPTHTYVNNTTNDLTLPVTLIASNAFGCTDTTTAQVTTFPNPTAQFTLSALDGCHPLTADVVNLSSGGDEYSWTYGDGSGLDTNVAVHQHTWYNFQGPGPISYPVLLTASTLNGCTDTATAQVTVYPQVTAGFVADTVGCSPFDPDFSNVSTGANAYFWDFGDGQASALASPDHLYLNQGLNDALFTAQLVASSAFGCTDTASRDILVHPAPIAQFTPDVLDGCAPLDVLFQDQTIGASTMDWDFGDGTGQLTGPGDIAHTFTNTSASTQYFDVELIAGTDFGCTDTTLHTIGVYPPVTALFTMDTAGCSPFSPIITDLSQGANNYLWDMGDGTLLVGPSPSYTYLNNTTNDQQYTVTLITTSAFGCTDTLDQPIVVHPVPVAGFQATPFTQQYPASTVSFNNLSGPGNWNYSWDLGDGTSSSAQDPADHDYGTWGTFTISLIVSGTMCSDTAMQLVEILPPPPTASFQGGGQGCAPLTVQFTNTSVQATNFQWNFGDGSTSSATDPIHTYTVPGTYTVTLTAFGLGGSANTYVQVDSVIVHPNATAYFVLQPTQVVVPSQPVFTYNLSGNATDFQWDFGDGTTSTEFNPVHYYQSAGTFDVMLVANNAWNCPDTFLLESAVIGEASGDIRFPNAFTPGSSGPTDGTYDPNGFTNDHFFPVYQGVEKYRLQVFNRWGELVFETNDVTKGWDGFYRGSPAKQDVYAWKAYAKFSDGREEVLSGDVTLLR